MKPTDLPASERGPQLNRLIGAAGGQPFAIRRVDHGFHFVVMTDRAAQFLAGIGIPPTQSSVSTQGDEKASIGGERQARVKIKPTPEPPNLFSSGYIPEVD